LRSVELDHDGLENLYLIDNFLHNINLSKVSNLVNLSLSSNLIDEIVGLEKLTKLEDFRVNGNSLDSLDVRGLINL
jgi:hypothetical protein